MHPMLMVKNREVKVGTEFRIGDHTVVLSAISGIVAESSSRHDRSYSEQYSTLMGGSYLHSELREETNFFLQRDDGGELVVSFPARVPLRSGHKVTVVYGTCSDGQSVTAIAMLNDTLGTKYELPLDRLFARLEVKFGRAPFTKFGCATILIAIVFLMMAALLTGGPSGESNFLSRLVLFLIGWFIYICASVYVIDPLINAAEAKKVTQAFKDALTSIADSRDASGMSSAVARASTQGKPT